MGKPKKPIEKFKSRKEVRKDKRLQKKANRVHFQKRKKELKLEYKERIKQKNQTKNGSKKNTSNGKVLTTKAEEEVLSDAIEDDFTENGNFDDDEEIESDFELSDEELEMKTKAMSKQQV